MSDIPEPNIEAIPAADIIIHNTQDGAFQTESYKVKTIQTVPNDYMITIKKSLIQRIYQKLLKIKKTHFNWDELTLIIFSATSSSAITAAFSYNNIKDDWHVLLFTVLPIIAAASLIFVIMYKIFKFRIGRENIDNILEELKPINDIIQDEEKTDGSE